MRARSRSARDNWSPFVVEPIGQRMGSTAVNFWQYNVLLRRYSALRIRPFDHWIERSFYAIITPEIRKNADSHAVRTIERLQNDALDRRTPHGRQQGQSAGRGARADREAVRQGLDHADGRGPGSK